MNKKFWSVTIIVLSLIVVVLLVYLARYNKDEKTQSIGDFENRIKIHFSSSWAGYDANAMPLQKVLNKFEEDNPNIEIVNESMAGEDFLFTLKTDFASGNEPDVFGLWPGSDFDLLVKQGKIADLTDLMEDNQKWYGQFKEETWKYVTVNNRIYGLPFEIIYEGLFVNKDLFHKYEVKIPETFDELIKAVDIFNRNDVIPIAYNSTPEGSYIYQNIVMKIGGKANIEKPFDDKGNLKDCFEQGMIAMKTLYEHNAFPENAFVIDDKTRNDLFTQGKAAMIVQGSWFIGEEGFDPDDNSVDIVPFPSFENGRADDTAIIYGCGNGIFHMSQKAWDDKEKRKYSIKLLQELTSEESAKIFNQSSGFISNIMFTENNVDYSYVYKIGEKLINESKELVGPTDSFINRTLWEEIIVEEFPNILQGSILAEDVIGQVEKMKGKIE